MSDVTRETSVEDVTSVFVESPENSDSACTGDDPAETQAPNR
jgi:hypothetical protein